MSDYRAMLESGRCTDNHGCNIATTCMCALAEDLVEDNERLRAALQAVLDEWREGYGLHCVEQVRAALGTPKEQTPDELPKNHR